VVYFAMLPGWASLQFSHAASYLVGTLIKSVALLSHNMSSRVSYASALNIVGILITKIMSTGLSDKGLAGFLASENVIG
jgi:hypothetical protein